MQVEIKKIKKKNNKINFKTNGSNVSFQSAAWVLVIISGSET